MNFRKKWEEEVPKEPTQIWSCTEDDCKGWMRDNFAFEEEPNCPLCSAPMKQETKLLPQLTNMTAEPKQGRRSVQIHEIQETS